MKSPTPTDVLDHFDDVLRQVTEFFEQCAKELAAERQERKPIIVNRDCGDEQPGAGE